MNLDIICKQIVEDLSNKLYTNRHNDWSLYTLGDIGSFVKTKLLQMYKEYYLYTTESSIPNYTTYIALDWNKKKRELKKIQFYPKKSSHSNYIEAIIVTSKSSLQKELVDSLYLSLNKHIKHDTLLFGESIVQTKYTTKQDSYTANFDIKEKETSNNSIQSFNPVIELNLSILDNFTF